MDLNGDGFNDILSGCYSQNGHASMVGSFWVLYGDKQGKFAKPVELTGTDGKLLQVVSDLKGSGDDRLTKNICTRPFAVDWNGDGHLDILTGNFEGTFYLFTGQGKGKFAPTPVQLTDTSGKPLKISGVHSDPFIVDWDGDGDLDLLTGSSDGNIFWAENTRKNDEKATGADRTPELTALKLLIKAPAAAKDAKAPSYGLRVWAADITGDGKLDILVGDRFTSGGGMRQDLTKEEQAACEKAEAEYQQVMKDYQEAYRPYNEAYQKALKEAREKAGDKEVSQDVLRAIYKEHVTDKVAKDEMLQALLTKMREANTALSKYRAASVSGGNVWLYEQK
ncbi:MAG: VCBS repeat-containing protein [Planctomycetes bacterium]|nr:VCBS repeat-containing protein [Planctomycetota bacterium]